MAKGRRGSMNGTHASFLNSLAGPKQEEGVGGGGKEKKVSEVGAGLG